MDKIEKPAGFSAAWKGILAFFRPLANRAPLCFKRPLQTARPVRAAVAVCFRLLQRNALQREMQAFFKGPPQKESQMPKLKTKSGAKKRFKVTGTGKVLFAQAGKRHGMIKRTNKQIRNHRGTSVLFKSDGDNIKRFFLPNG